MADVERPDDLSPQVRTFLDREMRDLLTMPEHVAGVLAIAAPEIAARLDCSRAEVVPRSFLAEDLREKSVDLLVRLPYRDAPGRPDCVQIYFLLEHQSQPMRLIAQRIGLCKHLIWEDERLEQKGRGVPDSEVTLRPILPVVFYTGDRPWDHLPGLAELTRCPPELLPFIEASPAVLLSLTVLS